MEIAPKVVIVGGGYGGVAAAARLEVKLGAHGADVTMVSSSRYLLMTPMLSLSASGIINPRHALFPLKSLLSSTDVFIGEATRLDLSRKVLEVQTDAREAQLLRWDRLILAPGCVTRFASEPGPAELSIGTKDLKDANAIGDHILAQLALAEAATDGAERRARLTFVVVGAGYSGTEFTAQMQAVTRRAIAHYPSLDEQDMRWILIHRSQTVMPGMTAELAQSALQLLRRRGVQVLLGTTIVAGGPGVIRLSTGERVQTETLIWSAGTRPRRWVRDTGLPLDRSGRIVVNDRLEVVGHPGVFAVGDAACVPDAFRDGEPAPQTATHAKAQGMSAADNLAASLDRGDARTHQYKDHTLVVNLGDHRGLGLIGGLPLRGTTGWIAAFLHRLAALPKGAQRRRIALEWLKNSAVRSSLLSASAAELTRSAVIPMSDPEGFDWGLDVPTNAA